MLWVTVPPVCTGGEIWLPFGGRAHLRGAVEVLFEAQLKGLAHGADHALGKALTAFKDVAGWEGGARQDTVAAAPHTPRPPRPHLAD